MKKQTSLLLTPVLVGMAFGVTNLSAQASAVTEVEVEAGDTLWGISQQYEGISVNDLLAYNPEVNPYTLQIGQKISLALTTSDFAEELVTYTVQPGDTLWGIAQRYPNVTVEKLLQLNEGIDPYNLPVGMVLFLAVPDQPRMIYHTVQPGNTFFEIASVYDGVSVVDLRAANPHVNERELTIGSKIAIPLD